MVCAHLLQMPCSVTMTSWKGAGSPSFFTWFLPGMPAWGAPWTCSALTVRQRRALQHQQILPSSYMQCLCSSEEMEAIYYPDSHRGIECQPWQPPLWVVLEIMIPPEINWSWFKMRNSQILVLNADHGSVEHMYSRPWLWICQEVRVLFCLFLMTDTRTWLQKLFRTFSSFHQ